MEGALARPVQQAPAAGRGRRRRHHGTRHRAHEDDRALAALEHPGQNLARKVGLIDHGAA